MNLPIMFDIFSSDRVHGSDGEMARALVDVLEDRRLMSTSVEHGSAIFADSLRPAAGTEIGLDGKNLARGLEFGSGDITPIDLSGANGPQTFSAAKIDDGSGRDDLHRTGAAVEWLEKVHVRTDGAPLTLSDPHAAGRFSTGRTMTGNIRPVATLKPAKAYTNLFAA